MPDLLKIGKTTRDANQRADELYQTGVPTPFVVAHCVLTPNCNELEADMHISLADVRVSTSREFFRYPLTEAILLLDTLHREAVEGWLDDFLPDHIICEPGFDVDPSVPHILATHIDAHPFEIVDALGYMKPEEVEPAIKRRKDHLSGKEKMKWLRPDISPDGGVVQ